MDRGWMIVVLAGAACGRTPLVGADEGSSGVGETVADDPSLGCFVDLDSHAQDCDDDGIPDGDDPFPDDASRPGRARDDVIYANSATRLYLVDPDDAEVEPQLVGDFVFDTGAGGQVTDLAIDHYGVLYAVTFAELYVCDPVEVRCWMLGAEPTNSLAFLPVGVLQPDDSILVTVAGSTWTRLDLRGPEVSATVLGSVADAYSSSGDTVYDGYDTTWFTSPTQLGDILVSILPANGASDVVVVGNFPSGTYGLAAFDQRIWAFDQLGNVLDYEPYLNTALAYHAPGPEGFWGAAAHVDAR